MIDLTKISDFMYTNFENVSTSKSGDHFLARCLLCGDSKTNSRKRRFNLDYNHGNPIYNCFNCGRSGPFYKLYAIINGISEKEAKSQLYGYDSKSIINRLSNNKINHFIKKTTSDNFNWIKNDCISLETKLKGFTEKKYYKILKEFYDERYIDYKYKIFIAYKGDYENRIIIPIYDDKKSIIYFQARRKPKSDIIPKYKNPAVEKSNIIFNKNNFNNEKPIVIVEGLIDAFSIGNQGTSCLGKEISEEFIKNILLINDKIIICFDNDKSGYNSLIKFMFGDKKKQKKPNKYSKIVNYFIFPDKYNQCKDINNIRVRDKSIDIYEMILKNSFSYSTAYTKLYVNKNVKWR